MAETLAIFATDCPDAHLFLDRWKLDILHVMADALKLGECENGIYAWVRRTLRFPGLEEIVTGRTRSGRRIYQPDLVPPARGNKIVFSPVGVCSRVGPTSFQPLKIKTPDCPGSDRA